MRVMSKAFVSCLLIASMALLTTACAKPVIPTAEPSVNPAAVVATATPAVQDASATTQTPEPIADAPNVWLITMDKMDRHWVELDAGAAYMAEALGFDYEWDAPDRKCCSGQIEMLNNVVANGAQVVLIAANDPTALSQSIEDAKAKGIKFIYVDSPAYASAVATLFTDNYAAGKAAAETMLEELEAAGISGGKIGIIGVNTATNSTMNRENGFKEIIAADGRFTLLPTEYKDGDVSHSQDAAQVFIADNADLVGMFGTNEGSAVGIGNAIRASGKSIIGIGFDESDDIQALLNDGSLKAALVENPYTMGSLGMVQAWNAINGHSTGPEVIDTGVIVLRKE